ncbi:MAG: hypothetical protein HN742_11380 [Lentisphaerae bacterium]|nr:hypothetical protein [Lentisphaerota bacterium]MBT5609070.1 hypothetical protein [Lentisphaerota bacterium]MBT7053835.1 hypothetical protein [Lentisphaerota bacterium]MBT7842468.1 hypothetical protein [Lentisphaerota bacterium]
MSATSCAVAVSEGRVALTSPTFSLVLDTSEGLRAVSWENRQTGRTVLLGDGPEAAFDLGLPAGPLTTPALRLVSAPLEATGPDLEAVFGLASEGSEAVVTVTYRWGSSEPVLHKFVSIRNTGDEAWNRLLNVRLGDYPVSGRLSTAVGMKRGFPAYIDDEFFVSLAHPGGAASVDGTRLTLRQYPGARLAADDSFHSMEAVYGTALVGQARAAFLTHVTSRMRRTIRGHDRPYAIFEPFGARPNGSFDETEEFVLDSIAKVAEGQRQTGLRFDLYSVDFWVDYEGTLKECDPVRFPNGFDRIKAELGKLGTALGLWIDSSGEAWSIGGNVDVQDCLNIDPDRPESQKEVPWGRKCFCRATEPIRSMYVDAFLDHVRDNGVRLLKFDNLATTCLNPGHDHLPGIYSSEPIMDAVIEFLHTLDDECPDLFLMLYWGYRSPWWLLHGDTLFDSGLGIEAASPSTLPAPHARDSVTHKLDQAQWHASDVPALGKDSLGVWFSDWWWNSSIGKERWQEGFLMDLCRGSMLAQPWSDTAWLSPPERKQIAEFIALLRARPDCFRNSRFVVGNPQRDEPYGYCCSDGTRALIALHNTSWEDTAVTLRLNPDWGLPPGREWDLHRWYPEPARLLPPSEPFRETAVICLRPFQVVLVEVVPAGERNALDHALPECPIPGAFATASREVPVTARYVGSADPALVDQSPWAALSPTQAVSAAGSTLTVQRDGSILATGVVASPDTYTVHADTTLQGLTALRIEALPDDTLPGRGPGRAINGNYCLTELCVRVHPRGSLEKAVTVPLRNPRADFFQESYGGWPVTAVLDGDPETGWSIDPQEGRLHEAIFEFEKPVGFEVGTVFRIDLAQGTREHSLGRFRLSVAAVAPVPPPRRHDPDRFRVSGRVPVLPVSGLLVVTVEMSTRDGRAHEIRDVGQVFEATGTLVGQPADWQPVLGRKTYPSAWQAWRLSLPPGAVEQPFELTIAPRLGSNIVLKWQGHWVAD